MPLTSSQVRALQALRDHGPLRGREFAELMWPNSPGWQRYHKCGQYGSHQGGGMYRAGGAYLGRLARLGLVIPLGWQRGYAISTAGSLLLKRHGAKA